jgi:methylase of polypeptide subunit release factors
VIKWFKKNILNNKFFIDQKIIEVYKQQRENPWIQLLEHSPNSINISGTQIIANPKVFNPNKDLSYTASLIIDNLPDLKSKNVADIGTGTGIIAIKAAEKGAKKVIATDISNEAFKNAITNSVIHQFENIIDVIQTNLLDGIKGNFDYMFANLPIDENLWNQSSEERDNLFQKLLIVAKEKLTENGKLYIPLGSFLDRDTLNQFEKEFKKQNFIFEIIEKNHLNYTWYLYILSKK